jgi:hypothetical protein
MPIAPAKRLQEADAIDIWIARWLGIRRREILERYGCDPRRLYEVWWEERFPGSRLKAMKLFEERYPGLAGHVDFSRRARLVRSGADERQRSLFER